MTRVRYQWAVAAALVLMGPALAAQQVRGHTREVTTGSPVAGAVVSLTDSAGRTVVRTVTDIDGGFRLVGNGAAMEVRVIRIGFRPVRQPLGKTADANAKLEIAMTALPTVLEAVQVHDQSQCPARDDTPAAFALWEQARAALLATVVAREARPATVHAFLYTRDRDEDSREAEHQTVAESVFTASRAFVSGRPVASYDTRGYRDGRDGGLQTFYAPDADVLLDSAFVRGHCLSLRDHASGHPGEVGIAFSPAPRSDSVVNISGVLWLSRVRPALKSLDFRFTRLDGISMGDNAGGKLVFADMPNGIVMEEGWNLHLPIVRQRVQMQEASVRSQSTTVSYLAGARDIGGEASEASWPDGTTWYASDLGAVEGQVIEEGTGTPLVNAVVVLHGTSRRTRSDATGAFSFLRLLPGPYTIESADARFGVSSTANAEIVVEQSKSTNVRLTMPACDRAIARICEQVRRLNPDGPPSHNLVLGRTVFADGRPAGDAAISAQWTVGGTAQPLTRRYAGRADSTGTFELYDVPGDVTVTLRAAADSLASVDTAIVLDSAHRVASVTIHLVQPQHAKLPAFRQRQLSVIDRKSHRQLADAEIVEGFGDRVVGRTSPTGTASLAPLPEGPSVVRVQKAGYERRALLVDIARDDSVPITVGLDSAGQLDSITIQTSYTVSAARIAGPVATPATVLSARAIKSGFIDRASARGSQVLYTADFVTAHDQPLWNLLLQLGLKPLSSGGHVYLMTGSRSNLCLVSVYLDGVLYYAARSQFGEPPDFSQTSTNDYAAAEFFRSAADIPPQYDAGQSGCGALFLWTRD